MHIQKKGGVCWRRLQQGVEFEFHPTHCKLFFKEFITNLLNCEWNKVLKLPYYALPHHVSIESAFQFIA